FMRTRALFVLAWDYETEINLEPHREEVDGETYEYQNYSLFYWLDYAKELGEESPLLLVQTKKLLHGIHKIPQIPERQEIINSGNYPSIQAYDIHTEAQENDWRENGYADLLLYLNKTTGQMDEMQEELPKSWVAVRAQIRQLQNKEVKFLSPEAFHEICQEAKIDPEGIDELIYFLHNSGVFFHRPGKLLDKIILDQQWVIDAVYTVLGRESSLYYKILKNKGLFRPSDLKKVWQGHEEEDQSLFLEFMESCKICFKNKEAEENESLEYIAPALLPLEKPTAIEELQDNCCYFIKIQQEFLHYGIMQSLLCDLGTETHYSKRELWRNGAYLKKDKQEKLF
ncbi:MAG: COR domain-containing protein, partial [Bacteroidota bacterium]